MSSPTAKLAGIVGFLIAELLAFPSIFAMLFWGFGFLVIYTAAWFAVDWLLESLRPSSKLPALPKRDVPPAP